MPNNVPARWTFAVTARFSRFCGALVLAVLFGTATSLADPIDDRLEKADELKSVDYAQFESILNELGRDTGALSEHQSMFLDYLNAWRAAYGGDYATAIPQLRQIADHATDPTLRFRTLATIVNTLGIARR